LYNEKLSINRPMEDAPCLGHAIGPASSRNVITQPSVIFQVFQFFI
jgi:hypothetical protein